MKLKSLGARLSKMKLRPGVYNPKKVPKVIWMMKTATAEQ